MQYIGLTNPRTNEKRELKTGWSWTCFLFGGLFGIPLFKRKAYVLASVFVILDLLIFSSAYLSANTGPVQETNSIGALLEVIILGLAIFAGIKGNDFGKSALLKRGWVISSL